MTSINFNLTSSASEEIQAMLAEIRSIFALMGTADQSMIPRGSLGYAAGAGQRLLDQVIARMEAANL